MKETIGILGAGTMGTGIAEVAAAHGHPVIQFDINGAGRLQDLAECDFVIEAIFEDLEAKKKAFSELEAVASRDAILATNTSRGALWARSTT